jgi:hypothetical protein
MARAAIVLLLLTSNVSARPAVRLRAVVRVESAADRELLKRVRGYASDLEHVVVEEASMGPIENAVEQQLATASALAEARNAAAVIWFNHEQRAGVRIYVSQPARDRLLVRRVEPSRARNPSSAVFEAAALIVQSSLRSIDDGKIVGQSTAVETAEEPPAVEPPPAPPPPKPAAPITTIIEVPAPAPSGRWFAAAGAQWIVDGQTPSGEMGGAVGIGWQDDSFGFGVCLSSMVPTELVDARATLHLSRHTAAACGSWTPLRWRTLSLNLSAQLGYAGFYRETAAATMGVSANDPGLSSSMLVGAGMSERWQFAPAWAVTLGIGADFVPGSPTLQWDVGGHVEDARALWPVQPRVTLALEITP